ncbi:MAG: DNA polymerase III subunit delta [SAR202 cluster bacterium]|nr:DNA polymerase III subunit delta [SAR202 cluster bacterium]
MPILVFYGDSFLIEEALAPLKTQVGPPEVLEANSHRVSAGDLTMDKLIAMAGAMPFLAQGRLVVVEGLLQTFDGGEGGRRRAAPKKGADALGQWEGLETRIETLPPTTTLVFFEGALSNRNPMLTRLRSKAHVQNFEVPRGEELALWTRKRSEAKGAKITPGALRLLGQYVGGNLRALDSELDKLALYCGRRPIDEADVNLLVPQVREASIFAAVDAILEGRPGLALRLIHSLKASGTNFSQILNLVARQLRLVTLAKEMLEQGVAPQEIGSRLEIRAEFVQRKTLDQARKFPWPRIKVLYQRLVETDFSVKDGQIEEDLALELLVAEVAVGPR